MKIVQINAFYDEGSTGKIVADIHTRLLRDGHESHVIYGIGKREPVDLHEHKISSDKRAKWWGRLTRISGLRYNCSSETSLKALKLIDQIKPDIIHIHILNCFYINAFKLLKGLAKRNIPVLMTHHADVCITGTCDHAFECEKWKTGCYWHCKAAKEQLHSRFFQLTRISWIQMKNALEKIPKLYASGVSGWMSDRVKLSPMFAGRECRIIENGLDSKSFYYRPKEADDLRKKHGIPFEKKIVLHVTPNLNSKIKGGHYVIELARMFPNNSFIIVASHGILPIDSLSNIIFVQNITSKEELATYYSLADVTLLTSYRESFSMVTAESLCCGTPVVGFKAGAPETIALEKYSKFVDYGDLTSLKSAIQEMIIMNPNKIEISQSAHNTYDVENMYSKYTDFYANILNI